MSQNIVSQRFIICLKELKNSYKVKSDREFAQRVDYTSQNLSQIAKGKRDVTIELIRKAVEIFGFNAQFIFTGIGNPISFIETPSTSGVSFSEIQYIGHNEREKYIEQVLHENELPSKPLSYNSATSPEDARFFELSSEGMEPFLSATDVLLCKRIPKERADRLIRDYYIYVIVTSQDMFISRVINNIKNDGDIELVDIASKNRPTLFQDIEDVIEIWEITHVMKRWTRPMNADKMNMETRLENIGDSMIQNEEILKDLKLTLERVLKQMRDLAG